LKEIHSSCFTKVRCLM